METRHGLNDWGIGVRVPARERKISLHCNVQTGLLYNEYSRLFPQG
jgi:hypothetical protein